LERLGFGGAGARVDYRPAGRGGAWSGCVRIQGTRRARGCDDRNPDTPSAADLSMNRTSARRRRRPRA